MAPLTPEVREQIKELAETLTHLSVTYRYTKARAMIDKEFADKQLKSKRDSYNKRYNEDSTFREEKLAMHAKYLPSANAKLKNKYHTDEEYRQKKMAQNRAYYARKKELAVLNNQPDES